jgi:hypothetical protein
MTSRVVNVSTFYATETGVIYHPVSEEAKKVDHDVEQARERLSNILKARQKDRRTKNRAGGGRSKLTPFDTQNTSASGGASNTTAAGAGATGDYVYPESGSEGEEEYEHDNDQETEAAEATHYTAPLAIRQIERQLRTGQDAVADQKQDKMNKLLARSAAHATKSGGASKALPSQYVHQPKAADNAAKRAIVHHTGSHYVMAGSKQFQKGVRVKGVISRHSQQGAKLQAARSAKRNAGAAREDARGERAEGGGRSQGKSSSGGGKKKSKSKKGGEQS